MLPGVRPIISRASSPTATIRLSSETATTDGSVITTALALDVDEDVGRAEVDTDLHEEVETVPSCEARDPGAQIGELAFDVLIPPLDVVRTVNRRLAVRGERGEDQRGAGPQVADLGVGAVERRRAVDGRRGGCR